MRRNRRRASAKWSLQRLVAPQMYEESSDVACWANDAEQMNKLGLRVPPVTLQGAYNELIQCPPPSFRSPVPISRILNITFPTNQNRFCAFTLHAA